MHQQGCIFSTGVIFFTEVYIFDRGLYFSLIEITFQPIVYGNVSKYFGKKREEDGHTHQVLFKCYNWLLQQMSFCVSNFCFLLKTPIFRIALIPAQEKQPCFFNGLSYALIAHPSKCQ